MLEFACVGIYFMLWNGDIFNRDQHLQRTALIYGNGQLIRPDVYSAINFLYCSKKK